MCMDRKSPLSLLPTWEARDAQGKFLIRVAAENQAEAIKKAHLRGKPEAIRATPFKD